jgi:hypothetical protein
VAVVVFDKRDREISNVGDWTLMRRGALVGSATCYLARGTVVGALEISLTGNPAQPYRVTGSATEAIRLIEVVLKIQTKAREVELTYQIEGADSPARLPLSEDGESFVFTAGPELVDAAGFEILVKPIGGVGPERTATHRLPLNGLHEALGQLDGLDCS